MPATQAGNALTTSPPANPIIPPSAPSQPPAAPSTHAANKSAADIAAKYPEVIFAPEHLENVSLLFSKNENELINEALSVYDRGATSKPNTELVDDSAAALLNSMKMSSKTQPEAPKPLHNLYLGSIVYYSPTQWSVWINGKKLSNVRNRQNAEFYVSRLSRTEVEIVWKPASLQQVQPVWQKLTDAGQHPLSRVTVDQKKGTITLLLYPNQTFIPRTLAIREGLVISSYAPTMETAFPSPNAAAPSGLLAKPEGTARGFNTTAAPSPGGSKGLLP